MRVAESIELDAQTASELLRLSKARRVEARVQQRARVVLLAAEGWQNKDIAIEVRLDRRQVALWRRRFIEGGVQALLLDAARSGRTPTVTPLLESRIVHTTLYVQPEGAVQWSTRSLAAHLGLSATTVRRVWQRNGIKPHLHGTTSSPPEAVPRVAHMWVDVVGLYVNPRERALVISSSGGDDPQKPHRTGLLPTRTACHDQWRIRADELLSALGALERSVMMRCEDRHHHEDWFRFLRLVDRSTPRSAQLHLIVENHATHRRPKVQAWLVKQPRVIVHSVPTVGGWMVEIQRFLANTAEHGIHRESFSNLAKLEPAIARYLGDQGVNRRPFMWSVNAGETDLLDRRGAAWAPKEISAQQSGAPQSQPI